MPSVTFGYNYSIAWWTLIGNNADYTTVHNQGSGSIYNGTVSCGQYSDYSPDQFFIRRTYMRFITDGSTGGPELPAGAVVQSAFIRTIWARGNSPPWTQDDDSLVVVNFDSPPGDATDYGYIGSQTTHLGILDMTGVSDGLIDIPLNAAGLTKVIRAPLVAFAFRSLADINASQPAYRHGMLINMIEHNTGDQYPELHVTYGSNVTDAEARVTGLVRYFSAGPSPVYQLEMIRGSYGSIYIPPTMPKAPISTTETIESQSKSQELSWRNLTLADYGKWLQKRTAKQILAVPEFGGKRPSFRTWAMWFAAGGYKLGL
jgi:hypothetical protein